MIETINVNSGSETPVEAALSNLSDHLIRFDGFPFPVRVEVGLQAIKFPLKSKEREEILNLAGKNVGIRAKKLGAKAKRKFVWIGKETIKYNSDKHRELLARMIMAKFDQNEDAMEALLSTKGKWIIHEVGREGPNTSLPKKNFCDILMYIREKKLKEMGQELKDNEAIAGIPELKFLDLKRGKKLGTIFADSTKCTKVGACSKGFEITIWGFHPEKDLHPHTVMICDPSIRGENDCPYGLSKEVAKKIVTIKKEHPFKTWGRGEYTYSDVERDLLNLPGNEKIGQVLDNCTICPIGNDSCTNYFTTTNALLYGERIVASIERNICSLGITGDGDSCPLNK